MLSQKEGVFKAVCAVLECESFDGAVSLTSDQKKTVYEIVTKGFAAGEIEMKESARSKYDTEEKLRSDYVPGLVSNWLRKDLRLNGGEPYEAKNPGSRSGQGDAAVREMRKLLKVATPEQQVKIQAAIDERIAELAASKAKDVEINMDLIPEELRSIVQQ